MAIITEQSLVILKSSGLDFYGTNRPIADDFTFEPPCAIKFANVEQECSFGAFSYMVSGFICGVNIGRYCSIGEDVQIGRQNHPLDWLSTSPFFYLNNHRILTVDAKFDQTLLLEVPPLVKPATSLKKTTIGHDVWIGHRAIINAGITIGNGAIIAAGSVVTKNVADYAIVGGNPASLIRNRFPTEIIDQLLQSEWWRFTPQQISEWPFDNMAKLSSLLHNLTLQMPYVPDRTSIQQLLNPLD